MGLALLWKKAGLGSQDLLFSFKRTYSLNSLSGRYGIGHSGTLDPFAEGLLLVAWNEGLKILHAFQKLPKTYEVEMLLGVTSASHDTELTLDFSKAEECLEKGKQISEEFLKKFLEKKVGSFKQVPPQYSAIKVNGHRAYKFARRGESVELKARDSTLHAAKHLSWSTVEVEGYRLWKWTFEVKVSSGTYIRSFARDWGQELVGQEAVLDRLVRVAIGPFHKSEEKCPYFIKLSDLEQYFDVLSLSQEETRQVRHGVIPAIPQSKRAQLLMSPSGQAVAWREAGNPRLARVFSGDPFASAASMPISGLSEKSLVASSVKIH
ncbi:MAG: hypothetical protein KA116_01960 [Proteobacteria bacterium]|nr:hypothetical protein [Pseudomonadota bacterium]